ncbi:cytochrome c3 family protein [Arenicellales bacterium nBUS_48]|jgi:hypothetical protein
MRATVISLDRNSIAGLSALFLTFILSAGDAVADVVTPEVPMGRGAQCVEPIEIMRRDHFEFIKHQRDQTVYHGIRGSKHSLAGCIDCHASKGPEGEFLPINAEGQFCQTCHTYAAVKIDCFTCHATVPD